MKKLARMLTSYLKIMFHDHYEHFFVCFFALVLIILGFVVKKGEYLFLGFMSLIASTYFLFMPLVRITCKWAIKIDSVFIYLIFPALQFIAVYILNFIYFSNNTHALGITLSLIYNVIVATGIIINCVFQATKHIQQLSQQNSSKFDVALAIFYIVLFFALIYSIIYIFDKKSIYGIDNSTPFTVSLDMFYFSIVTFTTLGYGDMHPNNIPAKIAVIVEVCIFAIVISIIVVNIAKRKIEANAPEISAEIKHSDEDKPESEVSRE